MGTLSATRPATAAEARQFRDQGAWRDLTVAQVWARELASDPDRIVVRDASVALSVADVWGRACALAARMAAMGVGRGDVVSFQLPNWWEAFVLDAAIGLLGAVANPIVPIYRDAEVEFILRDSRAKVFVAPASFRNWNHLEMAERMRARLPELRDVIVVRGAGAAALAFESLCEPTGETFSPAATCGDDLRLLMYTSGTTGRAKGVLHTYNTLECEIANAGRAWEVGRGAVVLMPSPITHITGYLYAIGFGASRGATAVLMDRWDAADAVRLIEQHNVELLVAATPFLEELTRAARLQDTRLSSLRIFPCGGAPVAPETVRKAAAAFERCAIFRVYGSTEAPTVTLGALGRSLEIAAETDGLVVGHQVKIVDEAGEAVAPGAEGEILTRGPEVMQGYANPDDNRDAFDPEGYFRTGDLGRLRPDGALVITGRKKDLIIRGGENLSAKEIEDALLEHPGVREVSIVAMPHPRLGETVCAFAIAGTETAPANDELSAFLAMRGLAKQKWPERYEWVDELPKTAAGKVQKFVLRDRIQRTLEGAR